MAFSLYVHIPFCEVKCGYCDFFSVPRGYEDFDLQKEYVDRLIDEIHARAPLFSGRSVHSIFFGGGTPSLLDPPLIEKILSALKKYFNWTSKTEITLETNPKTVSEGKLRTFRSLGVNRVSIGVQSFQDHFLKVMGRIHEGWEAKKTVTEARRAGFENISIDMIYALPGQTFEDWKKDLEEALSLETPHLSAYHLTIEQGTPFEALHRKGRLNLPGEEESVHCLTWTRERLDHAGFKAYEISNFGKIGFESDHNRNYWRYGEYLGFGTAAASFVKIGSSALPYAIRRTNVRDLKAYQEGRFEGFSEDIDRETAMGEFCMLALRTSEGIEYDAFFNQFQKPFSDLYQKQISRWTSRGWAQSDGNRFQLTSNGLLFCDEVALSFLAPVAEY